jgi:hypothetical protein
MRRLASLVVALVVLSTVACGGSSRTCLLDPHLDVPWQIVNNANNLPITCAYAGAAALDLDINGTGGSNTFSQVCSPNASSGAFQIVLPASGTYTIDMFLLDPANGIISELHPPSFGVCADTATPVAVLPVNLP